MTSRAIAALLPALLLAGCALQPTYTESFHPVVRRIGPIASVPPAQTSDEPLTSPDRPTLPVPDVRPPGFVSPPPGVGLARYLGQDVDWSSCGRAECARIAVPLDYAQPDGQAITLSLSRMRATKTPRLGTIFVNPGGPGAPALWLASSFLRTGLEQYDVVAWDPRGSGTSTPVVCENGRAIDDYLSLDSSPDDQGEMDALIAGTKAFAAGCLARSGILLAHISTVETVADLDLLRQLQGDPVLNYVGYSYGTYIGVMYAQLHPGQVGRMVLDSPVNITTDHSIIQAQGFDLALANFAKSCAADRCALGASAEAVLGSITALLEKLDSKPLQVGDRRLTQSLATLGIATFLYGDDGRYESLLGALQQARQGDGSALLDSADRLEGRSDDGTYIPYFFAFPAIGCSDTRDAGVAAAVTEWRADQAKAPIFAKYLGPDLTCPLWPVAPRPDVRITAPDAPPLLIVGTTGDSATPYQYAVWMAEQLESGVLLTFEGTGHSTYGMGRSTCVDAAVQAYLAKGQLPAKQAVCRS